MPSKVIKCKDCKSEKKKIEENGAFKVESCNPLDGEESKPKADQKCKIVWRAK